HHHSRRHSFRECVTVFAITGQHVIVFANCGDRTDGNGFLTDVQVTEATDFAGDVSLRRLLFKAANQEHLPVKLDELIAVEALKTVLLALFDFVSFAAELLSIQISGGVDNAGRTLLFGSRSGGWCGSLFTHGLFEFWDYS